jgi:putative inorganic carbon (hco3(-)) transporter
MDTVKIHLEPYIKDAGLGKLSNKLLIASLIIFSVLFGLLIASIGLSFAFIIMLAIVAVPIIFVCIAHPKIGLIILLLYAFGLGAIGRLVDFPVGTGMDILEGLLLIGFFVSQKGNPDWKIYKNPISMLVLVWISYNLLQLVNPWSESRLVSFYSIRPLLLAAVPYFLFLYYLRDIKFVRLVTKVWIILSVLAAVYGLKQEFFGFAGFEERALNADPDFSSLLYINGHWRRFSFFSDPVTFSYNMVLSSLLCFALLWGPHSKSKKAILIFCIFLFLFAMLYTGTRGAYVLLPAAFALFTILTFNKKVILLSIIFAFAIAFLIFVPTSNYTLYRFQTAFRPSEDASFQVRKENQKRIQPYIINHPVGGGLGATGIWGGRLNPTGFLSNFPPDSGYVRIAVEVGWIGLLLFCTLVFVALKTGINNYYQIKNRELKTYCLGFVLLLFALNIGTYPQDALPQFPTSIIFCMILALISNTLYLDNLITKKAI